MGWLAAARTEERGNTETWERGNAEAQKRGNAETPHGRRRGATDETSVKGKRERKK